MINKYPQHSSVFINVKVGIILTVNDLVRCYSYKTGLVKNRSSSSLLTKKKELHKDYNSERYI